MRHRYCIILLLTAALLAPAFCTGQTGGVVIRDLAGQFFRLKLDGHYVNLHSDTLHAVPEIKAERHLFTAFYDKGKVNQVIHVTPGSYYAIDVTYSNGGKNSVVRKLNQSEFYLLCQCGKKKEKK